MHLDYCIVFTELNKLGRKEPLMMPGEQYEE